MASQKYEVDCILVLCTQAAWSPSHFDLVKSVLEMMAIRLGYATLPAYMAFHFQTLTYTWFVGRGLDLEALIRIRVTSKLIHASSNVDTKLYVPCSFKHAAPIVY